MSSERPTMRSLRRGKDLVQGGVAALWGLAFSVRAGTRTGLRKVRAWHSRGNARILVVAPHPDDEVCGCGGTLLLHRQRGDRVVVAFVTDGRRSTAYGLTPDEMARRRRSEAEAASAVLDVEARWLGLREGEWEKPELMASLQELLREVRPEWIYAPSCIDFHPEHHSVADALARVLTEAESGTVEVGVRIVQIQVPLTTILTNVVADCSSVVDRHRRALDAYQTQLGAILPSLRFKRYAARSYGVAGQAEELWELDGEAYARLHLYGPLPAPGAFRSFRHYALSDPLAYLVGRRERRRCRAWVEGEPGRGGTRHGAGVEAGPDA